jgi:hypothetical protein
VHSLTYALRDLLKFPLLVLITCGVCAIAYAVSGLFVSPLLRPVDVLRVASSAFRDMAIMLASLSPVCLFLAHTIRRPDASGLREYPFFLGLNVGFIALAGGIALVRQAVTLLTRYKLPPARALSAMGAWLCLSLLVGGQCAWYLRPFFGVATIPASAVPFFQGTAPDYRGDTSFYEAAWHAIVPPEESQPLNWTSRGPAGTRWTCRGLTCNPASAP